MIVGIFQTDPNSKIDFLDFLSEPDKENLFVHNNFAFLKTDENLPTRKLDESAEYYENEKFIVGFSGNIFNLPELFSEIGLDKNRSNHLQLILNGYLKYGKDFFKKINGNFIIVLFNIEKNKLFLVRDQIGVEPLYYFWDKKQLYFSSSLKKLLKYKLVDSQINYNGLHSYLLFNYNPLKESLIKDVYKLPPANLLEIENGNLAIQTYWDLSYLQDKSTNEADYIPQLLDLLKDSIRIRLEDSSHSVGMFLSGGMDSSSIVGLSRGFLENNNIYTYSFRCKGKSFDESNYAKIVADHYDTHHQLIEYPDIELEKIDQLVGLMEEPFSDIGIEIATYILGQAAHGNINYVLSGDGGDELFAGHPIYLADKFGQFFDTIPGLIKSPLTSLFQKLPDSDQKKNLQVKLKRFSYSVHFPPELYSNRWRIYYQNKELENLCQPETWENLKSTNPLDEIQNIYKSSDGSDYLSKSIYGDYKTVVDFYLNRMNILRHFNIEPRFPMFDVRLVEYAAKIPNELKIKNKSEKYIFHRMMEGILPDEIVFRKDKLGHSVPMKNWMRESAPVQSFFKKVLSKENLQKRGIVQPQFVDQMLNEHFSKKANNSHRLWSLLALELWMQKHID